MVPRNNPTTEIVTYTVQDDSNRKFFVDDYAPDAQHLLNDEGSNEAFEVVLMLSSHITVEGKLETDRYEPVKINVFLQKADKLRLMLLDGFGHTVVGVPQGYLHG
jgi:hypothetical protein